VPAANLSILSDLFLSQDESAAIILAGDSVTRLEGVRGRDLSEDDFTCGADPLAHEWCRRSGP